MASPSPSGVGDPPSSRSSRSSAGTTDAVLRNTLRYTISAREYAALHKYILSRSRVLRRATPNPSRVEKALQPPKGSDDYNARTVRHALRVFVGTWLGMKGWDVVAKRMKKEE